jgi:two-component system sensor histidine kinase YesM
LYIKFLNLNDLPIRHKLIIHFLLISILPSICFAILMGWSVNKIIEGQVNANTMQIITKVNESLDYHISEMQDFTYLISFNTEIKNFLNMGGQEKEKDAYGISNFLYGFTTIHPEIAGIIVVNAQGEYRSNEMYVRNNNNITEELWYQAAVKNKGIFKLIGHPKDRNITTHLNYKDDEVISVVRAILDPNTQEVKGVILIDLKLRIIAEAAKNVKLGKTGYLMVLDDAGSSIYTPAHPIVSINFQELLNHDALSHFSTKSNNTKVDIFYGKSAFTEWTTVGVFSKKDTLMEIRETRFYSIVFVFLVCMLGITASYFMSYTLSRPIWQLMSFMRKTESGDLAIRFIGKRKDEVGMLGQSFNRMLEKVNQLIFMVETKERQKKEVALQMLQMNIKPHFLYNTMDTIYWLSRKNGSMEVANVVESLSKLLRVSLSQGNNMITIESEIVHVESYLKIQSIRYKERLYYNIDIDPALKNLYVMKLIVQPLVENAIYHGIKEKAELGFVRVNVNMRDQDVEINVIDEGIGMDDETLTRLRKKLAIIEDNSQESQPIKEDDFSYSYSQETNQNQGGYGLSNVQSRIRLAFGRNYGLTITSQQGVGTTVTILHPGIHRKNEGDNYDV